MLSVANKTIMLSVVVLNVVILSVVAPIGKATVFVKKNSF
jgi:hypothetical protein